MLAARRVHYSTHQPHVRPLSRSVGGTRPLVQQRFQLHVGHVAETAACHVAPMRARRACKSARATARRIHTKSRAADGLLRIRTAEGGGGGAPLQAPTLPAVHHGRRRAGPSRGAPRRQSRRASQRDRRAHRRFRREPRRRRCLRSRAACSESQAGCASAAARPPSQTAPGWKARLCMLRCLTRRCPPLPLAAICRHHHGLARCRMQPAPCSMTVHVTLPPPACSGRTAPAGTRRTLRATGARIAPYPPLQWPNAPTLLGSTNRIPPGPISVRRIAF